MSGRKLVFDKLFKEIHSTDRVIWFHTASLGEFEQGLPVLKKLKAAYPNHKIVLTFFSPSGYEVKKDSVVADVITYLPLDTKANAQRFLDIVHPELVVFVKYEFWPNYLRALQKKNIKTILISAIFRNKHIFFKWYGTWMRKSLGAFNHFFVQDQQSEKLLHTIHFKNVTVSGDTRFDRVLEILKADNSLPFIADFKNNETCLVIGSSWTEDEAVFLPFINNPNKRFKCIIAPHNIKSQQIHKLKGSINKPVVLYSEKDHYNSLNEFEVFIIDTIGILTKIYSYADIAYVGGGMGNTGLHNTLEPAVFGIPVVIGKHFSGFKEAEDLVALKGILPIKNKEEFASVMTTFIDNEASRNTTGKINDEYIQSQGNAAEIILSYIKQLLKN